MWPFKKKKKVLPSFQELFEKAAPRGIEIDMKLEALIAKALMHKNDYIKIGAPLKEGWATTDWGVVAALHHMHMKFSTRGNLKEDWQEILRDAILQNSLDLHQLGAEFLKFYDYDVIWGGTQFSSSREPGGVLLYKALAEK